MKFSEGDVFVCCPSNCMQKMVTWRNKGPEGPTRFDHWCIKHDGIYEEVFYCPHCGKHVPKSKEKEQWEQWITTPN